MLSNSGLDCQVTLLNRDEERRHEYRLSSHRETVFYSDPTKSTPVNVSATGNVMAANRYSFDETLMT